MSLSATQDKATARQRPLSHNSRGTALPHLYYDSPLLSLPFVSPFLTLFQCALDFTPHCHVDVFLQRLACAPSLLRYKFMCVFFPYQGCGSQTSTAFRCSGRGRDYFGTFPKRVTSGGKHSRVGLSKPTDCQLCLRLQDFMKSNCTTSYCKQQHRLLLPISHHLAPRHQSQLWKARIQSSYMHGHVANGLTKEGIQSSTGRCCNDVLWLGPVTQNTCNRAPAFQIASIQRTTNSTWWTSNVRLPTACADCVVQLHVFEQQRRARSALANHFSLRVTSKVHTNTDARKCGPFGAPKFQKDRKHSKQQQKALELQNLADVNGPALYQEERCHGVKRFYTLPFLQAQETSAAALPQFLLCAP